jgi:hypothetical protein
MYSQVLITLGMEQALIPGHLFLGPSPTWKGTDSFSWFLLALGMEEYTPSFFQLLPRNRP